MMALELFGHPFSSYSWKALIPFYENDIAFIFRPLGPDHPENSTAFRALSPTGKFPLLADGDAIIAEATAIIEYLDITHPGVVRLVPDDPHAAVEVRMLDRLFDNYVMTPMQRIVGDAIRPAGHHDAYGVAEAREALDRAYAWCDRHMRSRDWAAGDSFSLADCAAGPSLFYADWAHPIANRFPELVAYRARLLARPSIKRCVDEARPYRPLFPLGAPDRD
jgi:glutathione S-transferase